MWHVSHFLDSILPNRSLRSVGRGTSIIQFCSRGWIEAVCLSRRCDARIVPVFSSHSIFYSNWVSLSPICQFLDSIFCMIGELLKVFGLILNIFRLRKHIAFIGSLHRKYWLLHDWVLSCHVIEIVISSGLTLCLGLVLWGCFEYWINCKTIEMLWNTCQKIVFITRHHSTSGWVSTVVDRNSLRPNCRACHT